MSDEWDFYPLRIDDEPASIFLDMGIANGAPVRGFDKMAYLRVLMRRARADGLSSEEEFEDLVRLEDAVTAEIARRSPTLYVGRSTSSGNRDFFFYAKDRGRYERAARSAMAAFPEYRFEIGVRVDREWSTYFNFLYPSPLSRQLMGNRKVLASLADNGDAHDSRREIDHYAVFLDNDSCDDFAAFVESGGFEVRAREADPADRRRVYLSFARADRPADIDKIVTDLFEAAQQRGGEYDGWGCEVVSSQPSA